jgi:hypothetical protein
VTRLAPLALVVLVLAGCGGGPRVTETRDVAAFDRVEVADSIDVDVVPGSGDVQVHAGKDVMDRIETRSDGGVLRLDVVDRGIVIGPDPLGDVRVTVAASDLQGVTVSGAGDVVLDGLDSDRFEISVEGAGEVEATGRADHLAASIDGAGDARLGNLSARTAEVSVQGAGDASVRVSERLDVEVRGAGDVFYSGDPVVSSDIQGAGDLTRRDRR